MRYEKDDVPSPKEKGELRKELYRCAHFPVVTNNPLNDQSSLQQVYRRPIAENRNLCFLYDNNVASASVFVKCKSP